MKRNYWPLFFIGIFSFVFCMIVWTVKSAIAAPVIEDKSFMKKYQEVDENYNDMMTSNDVFLSKYDFEIDINDRKLDLTTSDIKFSQRVVEKYSVHKNILKLGQNSLKIIVTDKITKEKKEITVELEVSKTISANSDLILQNEQFHNVNNVYTSLFEIKDETNWIITGSFKVAEDTGYIYIKTNAI
jgi:hypothetical protein